MPNQKSDVLGNIALVLSVICCVSVTSAFLYRQVVPRVSVAAAGQSDATPDRPVANWEALQSVGHRMGPQSAALTIVEFGDFECPACRGFFDSIEQMRNAHPGKVALVFRHWPLSYHRFAYPSARAVECAGAQGKFEPFYQHLYSKQDSLGLIPAHEIAVRTGVSDLHVFDACIARQEKIDAVERDVAVALALRGRGTPMLIINGIQQAHIPSLEQLDSLLARVH